MTNPINEYLDSIQGDLIDFTSRLIQCKSLTGDEREAAECVKREMEKLGFDEILVDSFGSVLGRVGHGESVFLYDAHIDIVDAKDEADWTHGPFSGHIEDGVLWGRGSVDTKSSVCAMVYGAHAMKQCGLLEGKTILVSASVMEEDFDGELLYQALKENNLNPNYCIIGEPSSLRLAVGHRGRAMYKVTTTGKSAHGSQPQNGVNAIYKMNQIIANVERQQQEFDQLVDVAEKGSVVLSNIECRTASLNAVPDRCTVYLDRRLALGETEEMVAKEMDRIVEGTDATWEIYDAVGQAYTGKEVVLHTFLPAWETDRAHPLVEAGQVAMKETLQHDGEVFKWEFSTNGFATNDKYQVPTIGIGPGDLRLAHQKDERCDTAEIVAAAKIYAHIACNI